MTSTQIIDTAVRDICSVSVTGASKSKVREIVVKAIKEILEEVVGEDDVKECSGSYSLTVQGAKNEVRAEIRANAAKVLGE